MRPFHPILMPHSLQYLLTFTSEHMGIMGFALNAGETHMLADDHMPGHSINFFLSL